MAHTERENMQQQDREQRIEINNVESLIFMVNIDSDANDTSSDKDKSERTSIKFDGLLNSD